jgi:hypothetical protein
MSSSIGSLDVEERFAQWCDARKKHMGNIDKLREENTVHDDEYSCEDCRRNGWGECVCFSCPHCGELDSFVCGHLANCKCDGYGPNTCTCYPEISGAGSFAYANSLRRPRMKF